jgi:hypothetical protein
MTRAGFEYVLEKHLRAAIERCPSLTTKRVSTHVLRHSCAPTVLEATKACARCRFGWVTRACKQRRCTQEPIRLSSSRPSKRSPRRSFLRAVFGRAIIGSSPLCRREHYAERASPKVAKTRVRITIHVTLNRGPDEWLPMFADPMRAQSAIDRLTGNAYDLVMEGESYRQRLKPRPSAQPARTRAIAETRT